jgi:hypothetical protein
MPLKTSSTGRAQHRKRNVEIAQAETIRARSRRIQFSTTRFVEVPETQDKGDAGGVAQATSKSAPRGARLHGVQVGFGPWAIQSLTSNSARAIAKFPPSGSPRPEGRGYMA